MAWKYETKSLTDIYELLSEHPSHPECRIIKAVAKMAYEVALFFEDQGVNEAFVKKYLNGELPYDALSKLHLKCTVLHQVCEDSQVFSSSHKRWLYKLAKVKATWHWPTTDKQQALESLMTKFDELQSLALSYTFLVSE